jgi:hypothetical protein
MRRVSEPVRRLAMARRQKRGSLILGNFIASRHSPE